MDSKDRSKLKKKIQVAASLTPHQAGKVTSAVLNTLSDWEMKDFFAGDTDSKEIIRQVQSELPRSKVVKNRDRTPDLCAKECIGPHCKFCPDFIAIPHLLLKEEFKGGIDNSPPFELEEEPTNHGVILTEHLELPVGSIILTPKEFELISHPLQGAIKSATNEKYYTLGKLLIRRHHTDDPEKTQQLIEKLIEEILIISKLNFKLDKL